MIQAVAFDMDGVLFDTERLAVTAWCYAGKKLGFGITEEMVLKTFGLNKENTGKVWHEIFGPIFPYDQAYLLRHSFADEEIKKNGVPVKHGLKELLYYLSSNGIPMTIATSSDEKKVRGYLTQAGINDYFPHIICGDQIEKGKPEPDIYLKAAEILGVPAIHCIAIEDSAAGILSAHRAGMKPVMIPDCLEPSDETTSLLFKKLNSLYEVIDFIKTMRTSPSNSSL